jgi:hypothetical protein
VGAKPPRLTLMLKMLAPPPEILMDFPPMCTAPLEYGKNKIYFKVHNLFEKNNQK